MDMEFLKRNGVSLLLLALLVLVALDVKGLSDQVSALQSQMNQQYSMMDSQIGSISHNVAEGVRQANQVVSELLVTGDGVNREERQLLGRATAKLRTYQADTVVTLVMTYGGAVTEIPMTLGDGGLFTAPVSLSPEGDTELSFSVIVDNGGAITREGETWVSLWELLPVTVEGRGSGGYGISGGQLELGRSKVEFRGTANYESIRVDNPQFRLYLNGRLEQSQDGQVDENLLSENQITYASEDWTPLSVGLGDEIRVTASCTDEHGLEYEFTLKELTMGADGSTLESHGNTDFPTLHWS